MVDYWVKTIEVSSDWKVNTLIKDKLQDGYVLHDTQTLRLANSFGQGAQVMFIFKKEMSGEK